MNQNNLNFFGIRYPKSNTAFANKIKIYRIINDILKNMVGTPKQGWIPDSEYG